MTKCHLPFDCQISTKSIIWATSYEFFVTAAATEDNITELYYCKQPGPDKTKDSTWINFEDPCFSMENENRLANFNFLLVNPWSKIFVFNNASMDVALLGLKPGGASKTWHSLVLHDDSTSDRITAPVNENDTEEEENPASVVGWGFGYETSEVLMYTNNGFLSTFQVESRHDFTFGELKQPIQKLVINQKVSEKPKIVPVASTKSVEPPAPANLNATFNFATPKSSDFSSTPKPPVKSALSKTQSFGKEPVTKPSMPPPSISISSAKPTGEPKTLSIPPPSPILPKKKESQQPSLSPEDNKNLLAEITNTMQAFDQELSQFFTQANSEMLDIKTLDASIKKSDADIKNLESTTKQIIENLKEVNDEITGYHTGLRIFLIRELASEFKNKILFI